MTPAAVARLRADRDMFEQALNAARKHNLPTLEIMTEDLADWLALLTRLDALEAALTEITKLPYNVFPSTQLHHAMRLAAEVIGVPDPTTNKAGMEKGEQHGSV